MDLCRRVCPRVTFPPAIVCIIPLVIFVNSPFFQAPHKEREETQVVVLSVTNLLGWPARNPFGHFSLQGGHF